MSTTKCRAVVIGGGYAGVMAANRMQGSAEVDVTLVNPRPVFVERIRLHQLAIDDDDAVEDYASLLNPDVELVVDSAERIVASQRRVFLASGATVEYDYLVYAVGSTGHVPSAVRGAAEHAYPISELEQAQRLRSRLAVLPLSSPVTVVGGGLTGIETASELAEAGRRVTLVSDAIAPTLSTPGRRSVTRQLAARGVTLVEGPGAAVAAVAADRLELADGRVLPSEVTVWTAGFSVPQLAASSGLSTDSCGRLLTDETLTSVDDARIVAAGDAAAPSDMPFRMSCQSGLPLGAHAGDTVVARWGSGRVTEVSVPMYAQCISVGRTGGTVQVQRSDDTPRRLYVGGRAGALIKERVCRQTLQWMRGEARKPGSYRMPKGPERAGTIASPHVSGAS
ncbi:NAD(P)/FAD-dependent oxidoreductase [Nocardioides lijunqiniae]|uniref:NAD(P)/FAD-dependent oxidoreductase n=1 Tax=Nocardioides lijunqiniae TaxID=2760832 RepID=UPI001878C1EE|nr:FAD-dependent oxidoreductase [Nocardioides lijunqiniae]